MFSDVKDPSQRSLTIDSPGRFVYLRRCVDSNTQSRITNLSLYRSQDQNSHSQSGLHSTSNINQDRGGDYLCLSWRLG